MIKSFFYFSFLLFSVSILLPTTSCVGIKKFRTEVSKRTDCDSTLQVINKHNMSLNREMAQLNLQLAEKTGEVKALNSIHDKQVKQIDHLESEIRRMTNLSQNKQQALGGELQDKENELNEKKAIIQSFKDALLNQEQQLKELVEKVTSNLKSYNSDDLGVEVKNGVGYIRLSESLIFRKGSNTLSKNAYDILESISRVLLEYPQMDIEVMGHTDNQPARNNDNWEVSTMRATPIARMLTKEFGLNPNQVTASGKADSKPISSNDTAEGREKNRRTEIVIHPPTDKILKMIQVSQ